MSGETILVIDDSREIIKHLTERVLPTFGYKTLAAQDGKTGLDLAQTAVPDLIMLDYNLPEMTGLDVLQQMAKEAINIPVIMMSGFGSEKSAIEAFRLGVKDYLIKPFTVEEIVAAIDQALVETRLLHDNQQLAEQLRRAKVEMNRQAQDMQTIFHIGKAITSLLSVDKVLERVLKAAIDVTQAEDSAIWRRDGADNRLIVYRLKEKRPSYEDFNQPGMTNSPVAQVLRTGRPFRHAVFSGKGIKVQENQYARSILYVPLKLRGETIGVLSVSNLSALRSFSKKDEFLLAFLADYAVIAIENAQVFQAADRALAARVEELNTLVEITRTITASLELEEVINLTMQQVHNSWNIEASSLWLLDDASQTLKVLANVGTPADILTKLSVPLGEGFVGHVAQHGKFIYTNDVASHPLHYREVDDKTGFQTRSLLCVPLMYGGKVVGALQLVNKQDDEFDDSDVERALSITMAVAIAVTNAKLFAEVESRQHQLETMIEHSNSPILITDANNNILLLNQQARQVLGLAVKEIGRFVADAMPDETLAALLTAPVIEEMGKQVEITLSDNTVWLARVAPIPEQGRILMLQDITQLRELDQAKTHFVAAVSHDMRSPLNSISGFVREIDFAGDLNEQQKQYVAQIEKLSAHMADMVDSLLELAKIDALEPEPFQACNLLSITNDVVSEFQVQAMAKRISLVLNTQTGLTLVHGNPRQLRSAITNLVDNAIKFSQPSQRVKVSLAADGQQLVLKVQDQGKGIPEKELPYIFEKFYRGQSTNGAGGAGLGLALVHSIAEAHHGEVSVESSLEKGSIFSIRLPVAEEASSV